MVSIREKIQSYSVVVTDDAGDKLADALVETAKPYISREESIPVDGLNEARIRTELSRILADGMVNSIEAYPLYIMVEGLAGSDRKLVAGEVDRDLIKSAQSTVVERAIYSYLGDTLSLSGLVGIREDVQNDPSLARTYGSQDEIEKAIDESKQMIASRVDMVSKGLFATPDGEISLFSEDDEKKEIFDQQMEALFQEMDPGSSSSDPNDVTGLDGFFGFMQIYLSRAREEDMEFLNYISIENMYSLAAFFNEDRTLFTTDELKGVERLFSYLGDAYIGAKKFKANFDNGTIDLNDRYVRIFLESPLASMVDWDYLFDPTASVLSYDENNKKAEMYLGLAVKAKEFGAGDLAAFISQLGMLRVGPLAKDLELAAERAGIANLEFLAKSDFMMRLVNCLFSLDSIAILTGAGVLGAAAGSSTRAVQLVETAASFVNGNKFLRFAKYAVPGISPFRPVVSSSRFVKAMDVSSLIGFEFGKFVLLTNIGYEFAGETGGRVVSGGLLLLGGFHAAYARRIEAVIVRGMNDPVMRESALFKEVMERRDLNPDALERLAQRFREYESLRPALRPNKRELTDAEKSFLRLERESIRALQRAQGEVDKELAKIEALRREYPQLINDGEMEEVRRLAGNRGSAADCATSREMLEQLRFGIREKIKKARYADDRLRALEGLSKKGKVTAGDLDELRRLLSDAERGVVSWDRPLAKIREIQDGLPAAANGYKTFTSPLASRGGTGGSASRAVAAEPIPAAVKPVPATNVARFPELNKMIKTPPETLDIADIAKLTEGKVKIDGDALEGIQGLYSNTPELRGQLWKRILELAEGVGQKTIKGWKKLKTEGLVQITEGTIRARVGKYRVLAVRDNGGFKIYRVGLRKDVYID